jgi:RNA recognition motif-containing protein
VQTFYFECFPTWLTFIELRNEFQRYGTITKLFISKRLNKYGKRFGFLSLCNPEADITEKLNKIWFSSYKLCVNIAKYQRHVVKQKPLPVPTFSPQIKVPIK